MMIPRAAGVVAAGAVHREARVPAAWWRDRGPAPAAMASKVTFEIVPGRRLGGGREERRVDPRALDQTAGNGSPARVPRIPVLGPGRAGEIAAHHALERHRLGAPHQHGAARDLCAVVARAQAPRRRSPPRRAVMKCEGTTPPAAEPERAHLREHDAFCGIGSRITMSNALTRSLATSSRCVGVRPRRPRAPFRGAATGAAAGSRPRRARSYSHLRASGFRRQRSSPREQRAEVLVQELADLPRRPAGVVDRLQLRAQVGGGNAGECGVGAEPLQQVIGCTLRSRRRPRRGCAGG